MHAPSSDDEIPNARKQAETTQIQPLFLPATGSDTMLAAAIRVEIDMDQTATAPNRFSCTHATGADRDAAA
jgi:hypothetical protein